MIDPLKDLRTQAIEKLTKIDNLQALDEFVLRFFGRSKGKLTNTAHLLKGLDARQRKNFSEQANIVKIELWKLVDETRHKLKEPIRKKIIKKIKK